GHRHGQTVLVDHIGTARVLDLVAVVETRAGRVAVDDDARVSLSDRGEAHHEQAGEQGGRPATGGAERLHGSSFRATTVVVVARSGPVSPLAPRRRCDHVEATVLSLPFGS